MIQNSALSEIATLIAASGFVTKLLVGTSSQQPSREDTALVGTQLAEIAVTGAADGNTIKYVSAAATVASGNAKEVVLEDATGEVKDRMVLPTLAGGAGTSFVFEYTLSVVGSGES